MKVKNNKKERRGISLIVLVITIIVIIVLAVAVILTVAKNNPIESAKRAVFLNDMKAIEEEINLYIASNYVDSLGGDSISINLSGERMKETFPSTAKYEDKIMIINGEIKLTDKATNEEKVWASENGIEAKVADIWDGSIDTSWYNETDTEFYIYTAEELAGLAKLVNDKTDNFSGKTLNLASDIDLNNLEWEPIGTNYNYDSYFSGAFNGNDHYISKAKIENCDGYFVGLFGYIYNGELNKLLIKDSIISTNEKNTSLYNCGIAAFVGGAETSNIKNCYSLNNEIKSNNGMNISGVCGYASYDTIVENCYNSSNIIGQGNDYCAGGIVSWNIDGSCTIRSCYNSGNIIAENASFVGGIMGLSFDDSIYNSYNTGILEGNVVGGILGCCDVGSITNVENCYNIGELNGITKGSILGIAYENNSNDIIELNSCLYSNEEEIVGSILEDSNVSINNSNKVSIEELKSSNILSILGETYKQDISNINNGYPILKWQ